MLRLCSDKLLGRFLLLDHDLLELFERDRPIAVLVGEAEHSLHRLGVGVGVDLFEGVQQLGLVDVAAVVRVNGPEGDEQLSVRVRTRPVLTRALLVTSSPQTSEDVRH